MALTKTIDPDARIPCASEDELERELTKLEDALAVEEGEDTWEKLERAVIRFAGITRGGGYKHTAAYVEGIGRKRNGIRLVQCMLSDRGRLSGAATDLLATMAPRLALHFGPLCLLYLPPIIKLLARPNKVFLRRSEKCLHLVVSHCPVPAIIPLVMDGVQNKNEGCRRACAVAVQEIVNKWEKPSMAKHMADIEGAMKRMATDKDSVCRKAGKAVWERYKVVWPERVDAFSDPLTPTTRRYLDVKAGSSAAPRKAAVPPAPRPAPSANFQREPPTEAGPSQPAARLHVARVVSASTVATSRPGKASTEASAAAAPSRPAAARSVSNTVHNRARPVPTVDVAANRPLYASHSRSQSSSTTSEPAAPGSISRPTGGLGKPVRPAMPHNSSSTLSASLGPNRRPGVLGAAVRPPVRMPSSKSLKGVVEGGELHGMMSAAPRANKATRVLGESSAPRPQISVERMRKQLPPSSETANASAPHSPTPRGAKASSNPLVGAASAPLPNPEAVSAPKPPKPLQARAGVNRTHAAFRPVTRDTKQALAARAAKDYTGPVPRVPHTKEISPAKKATVARVKDVAQVLDPIAPVPEPAVVVLPASPASAPAPAANPGVQDPAHEEAADDGDDTPLGEDATLRLSAEVADPIIVAPVPVSPDAAVPAAESSDAAAAQADLATVVSELAATEAAKSGRTNIFAPPAHTDFVISVKQNLAPKDIPLPPSPRPEGNSDEQDVAAARQLRHQPSIAQSIGAASSNGTVAADWDDEHASASGSTDAEAEELMMCVSFKTPARRGQPIKEALLKRIAARSAAEEAEARAQGSPSSDLLQFSEEDAASVESKSSGGVSPKIAAITQLLLDKSTNTVQSPIRALPQNDKSKPAPVPRARGFTPVRHDRQVPRPGSTTPADTPPVARKMLSKSSASREAPGAMRPAVLGRWH